MSVDTHEYVHRLLERSLDILVIEQESASDLGVILDELNRHGYSDAREVTVAATTAPTAHRTLSPHLASASIHDLDSESNDLSRANAIVS